MTTFERNANLTAVAVPFLAFLGAVVTLWGGAVDAVDLAILGVWYVFTALGVTVGFHRLLTHRAFDTPPALAYAFAILGSMSVQGPVIDWVADHRKHHANPDQEGDPHSPHGHGGMIRGLFYAHMGWLLETQGQAAKRQYARDLIEDPVMRTISKLFPLWVLLGLLVPFAAGLVLTGTLAGGLTALLWGGLVRIFLVHHVTWSINSICHVFGTRRFETDDHSGNVFWLALPSLGEAWHHNHHAFPRSAEHGLRRGELDPSGWVISALERVGLARQVVRISPERQERREREAREGQGAREPQRSSGVAA